MHEHVSVWFVKLVTSPPEFEFFSNEYEALQILTISILTHVHWVSLQKLASLLFLPFVTSHGSLPRAHSSLYLWRILMKFRDTLNITGMIFGIISVGFFFVLIFTKSITLSSMTHSRTLWYLTSMCFVRLWSCDPERDESYSGCQNEPELNHVWY